MNFVKTHRGIRALPAALLLLVVQCCAPAAVTSPVPALTRERVASVISAFADQEKAVETLFFTGTLTVLEQGSENSVQILMIADATPRTGAGVRLCGRIKIEITHPWGKALIHILMKGRRVDILDFTEKRFYTGHLNSTSLSDRLPVPLDPSILWSLARAFPALVKHQSAVSLSGNQITLLDSAGNNVQVFELYSSEPLPHRVFFSREKVEMIFSHFDDEDGILYARRMNFHGPAHKVELAVEINKMTFNTPLPEAVFEMEAPRDFRTVRLRDDVSEH